MRKFPLTPLREAYAFRLGHISRLLRRRLISVITPVDSNLSPEQFVLIMRVAEENGVPQSEFVDPVLDDRANITRQVKGLVTRGLVRVDHDLEDQRRKRVYLTPAGRVLFERLVPHVIETRHALFGQIPKKDLAVFSRVLTHLEHSLS